MHFDKFQFLYLANMRFYPLLPPKKMQNACFHFWTSGPHYDYRDRYFINVNYIFRTIVTISIMIEQCNSRVVNQLLTLFFTTITNLLQHVARESKKFTLFFIDIFLFAFEG